MIPVPRLHMNSVNAYHSENPAFSHRVNRNSASKNSEIRSHVSRGASNSVESDTIITRVSRENSASHGI